MTNARHNITSHMCNMHNPQSTRARKMAKDPRHCGICDKVCGSFTIFQSHIRNVHYVRGPTTEMWDEWQSTSEGDVIEVTGR
ncbi:hypothetical protein F5Y13DRAFT_153520 [Hypoxylon sp. FL1857]|nr:hypothetical protein F5Y13DRAFT_153520 [Hypoxylon sp. FL1857]